MYPASATGFLLEHTPVLSAFTGTVLLLLAEYARLKQSPFREYIMSLPQEVDCLLTWSKDDKAELEGEERHITVLRLKPSVIFDSNHVLFVLKNGEERHNTVFGLEPSTHFHSNQASFVLKESSQVEGGPAYILCL